MSETNTFQGTLKVKRNIRPHFGEVFFAWMFYGFFRYWTLRLLLPWGIWGAFLHYFLLFSAISLTLRALFTPRYRYEFHAEVEEPKSDDYESKSDPIQTQEPPTELEKAQKFEVSEPKTALVISKPDIVPKPEPKEVMDEPESIQQLEVKPEPDPQLIIEPENKPEIKDGIQYCTYCGVENPDFARFCATCGERLR